MFRYMAAKGVAVTPTLSLGHILSYWDEQDRSHDAYLQYIGKGLQSTYTGRVNNILRHDAAAIEFRKANYEKSAAVLADLVAADVTILAGTDAGYLNSYCYPGLALHEELALMVKYGMTPQQALKASVINGPKFLGQKGYGAVAPGNHADLLLLDANPLEDIHNTLKIRGLLSGEMERPRPTRCIACRNRKAHGSRHLIYHSLVKTIAALLLEGGFFIAAYHRDFSISSF